jgi:hypothetical protein
MTHRKLLLAFAFTASTALLGAGCHHEHLSSNYGEAYATWFAAQHVNHPPANPEQARRVIDGLDAQEAAIVSRSYRRAATKGEEIEGGGRMLMVSPNRGAMPEAYVPPPSVPGQ